VSRSWLTALAVGVAGVAAAFLLWPASAAMPRIEIAAPPGTSAGVVTVHVSGAVAAPGLVSLPTGSRVADAVLAAGGALPGADLMALNLAAPIVDGQQLVVPNAGIGGVVVASDGRVRVNTADAAALEGLPGVGPVLAERIVAYREAHGPFGVIEDLLEVPGIGESKLAALRDRVIVP
jgi:competence protein ComEA